MLVMENIKKRYIVGSKELWALGGISVTIEKGDFVALKGPSGSGKSTLLNIIGLLDSPTEGTLKIEENLMNGLSAKERSEFRAKYLGFIFQNYNLIPELTIYENVEIPLLIARENPRVRKETVMEIIEDVGLKDHVTHRPGQLSGGQQQRVAIARALVKKPPVVIADEPTANLDSRTGKEIMDLMKELNQKHKSTFVFATHDEGILEHMNKIFHLVDGKIHNITKR